MLCKLLPDDRNFLTLLFNLKVGPIIYVINRIYPVFGTIVLSTEPDESMYKFSILVNFLKLSCTMCKDWINYWMQVSLVINILTCD